MRPQISFNLELVKILFENKCVYKYDALFWIITYTSVFFFSLTKRLINFTFSSIKFSEFDL